MLLDEADFAQSSIGSDIVKILNCGYQQNLTGHSHGEKRQGRICSRVYEVFGQK